jgi:hypothetical protein
MKHTALVVLLLALLALLAPCNALSDHVGVYADITGDSYSCMAAWSPPGPAVVYVIHKFSLGTVGSRWKVNSPAALSYVSNSTTNTVVGDPASDVTVAYGACLNGSISVMTLTYVWSGEPILCGMFEIAAVPGLPTVLTLDCSFAGQPATGGRLGVDSRGYYCCPTATEAATWGKVKALYR